jgi:glycosyltransferase involved in cell wall biosynthesis
MPARLQRLTGVRGQVARTSYRLFVVAPQMAASVLTYRPDVVNIHFPLDGLAPTIVAWITSRPVVMTFHGPWAGEAEARSQRRSSRGALLARRSIERLVYRLSARSITLSVAFGQLMQRDYGVARETIHVIPGGIAFSDFEDVPTRGEARAQFGIADEEQVIVTVRRLVPRVGLDLAIEALAGMQIVGRSTLLIAGTGPELARLEDLATRLGIRDCVRFMGFIPDGSLKAFYAAGNICVVPSRSLEGFGYGALESLAAGTPVIATNIGGLSEVVGGLDPRWVTEPSADAIQRAMESVLRAPSEYPASAECREYARRLDWTNVVGQVEAVFEAALGRASAR